MTERRRFEVVPPDWGEAHLTPEAVVAYVDGELAAGPHDRATRHLGHCADCVSDVIDQRQARTALRGADCPSLPSSLMSSLRAIPQSADLPDLAPPAGLSVDARGEFVALAAPTRPARRTRRMRLGAGAAVSGLALGALAFGVPASGSLGPPTGPAASFGTGSAQVARFAATPAPVPPPAATPSPTARPTMLNASRPKDGR